MVVKTILALNMIISLLAADQFSEQGREESSDQENSENTSSMRFTFYKTSTEIIDEITGKSLHLGVDGEFKPSLRANRGLYFDGKSFGNITALTLGKSHRIELTFLAFESDREQVLLHKAMTDKVDYIITKIVFSDQC